MQLGIEAVLSTRVAGSFTDSVTNTGLLPVTLPPRIMVELPERTAAPDRNAMTVDLESMMMGGRGHARAIRRGRNASRRHDARLGSDRATWEHADAIRAFETDHLADNPLLGSL